jgi:hypothetical protein
MGIHRRPAHRFNQFITILFDDKSDQLLKGSIR